MRPLKNKCGGQNLSVNIACKKDKSQESQPKYTCKNLEPVEPSEVCCFCHSGLVLQGGKLLNICLGRHVTKQGSSPRLLSSIQFSSTPWTAAHQASLSIANSQSLLKLMSIELVMPSNHLILCCPDDEMSSSSLPCPLGLLNWQAGYHYHHLGRVM